MTERMSSAEFRRLMGLDNTEPKKNKFRTVPPHLRTWTGTFEGVRRKIIFQSLKEMNRFIELLNLQRAKLITHLQIQKKFELVSKQKDERAVSYYADFYYCEAGQWVAEDVKSDITRKLKSYIIKRKLFKKQYPEIIFKEMN